MTDLDLVELRLIGDEQHVRSVIEALRTCPTTSVSWDGALRTSRGDGVRAYAHVAVHRG